MKKYSTKWIAQRITALLLVPLFFWFIYHCISFQNFSYEEIVYFFSSFINSFLFLILMITMLIHSQLGCETIIEDYISSRNYKIFAIWGIKFITYVTVSISVISVISIVF